MTPWYKQKTTWAGALGVAATAVTMLPDYKAAVACLLAGVAGVLGGTNTTMSMGKNP